jgi:S1-C subfamily serine protease
VVLIKRLLSYLSVFVLGFGACAGIVHWLPPYQGQNVTGRPGDGVVPPGKAPAGASREQGVREGVVTLTGYAPRTQPAVSLPAGAGGRYQVADAIARVEPAVVNIDTVGRIPKEQRRGPTDRFLWRFFGKPSPPPDESAPRGIASGVLISDDGTIVTNNHVVADAERILVTLPDQRRFEGVVLGTDPDSDLAIVKIQGRKLPQAAVGDSGKLRKGEWVVALGNPLGLGSTATVGVVSAARRGPFTVEGRTLRSVIQTDAAINQGNSGGALVNLDGELVGINTAILSTSFAGGSIGIGFAIPMNDAWPIVRQLLRGGRVVRPWIGIVYETAAGKAAWQETNPPRGVVVRRVLRGSPAAAAGMVTGDVVRRLGSTRIEDTADIFEFIGRHSPGDTVEVRVQRGSVAKSFRLRLAQKPDQMPDETPEAAPTAPEPTTPRTEPKSEEAPEKP